MALFGRRKPGFAKEVELRPSEIPGEFSDKNDPALNDNPKGEDKEAFAAAAQAVMGEVPAAAEAQAEKPELFAYMQSLPEVNDPYPPSEAEPEAAPEPELTPTQTLAAYISQRTEAAELTPLSLLRGEIENADELLAAMAEDDTCRTIATVQGAKEVYYYDSEIMTKNYAMIAMLIADKDLPRTMAEMVRWNCKTYPSPTPKAYFKRHPYYMTDEQLDVAVNTMANDEKYRDIKCFVSGKGETYLYSDMVMSERYAKSLADFAEDEENS
ncbi:MAG: hypothetical protein IJ157_05190 [Clostridia bacterium]|nr:hypothetical protein [Clostridia bacterium]